MTALLDRLTDSLSAERHGVLVRQAACARAELARIYHDPAELAFAGTADDMGIGGTCRPQRS